jgi:hypothetical protein
MSEQHELRHVQHSDVQPHPSSSRFSSDADVDNAELELDERDERARMLRSSLDGSEGTSGEGKHDPDEVEGLVEGSIEALIAKVSSSRRPYAASRLISCRLLLDLP